MSKQRKDRRIYFVILGMFVLVFLVTLLMQKIKDNNTEAASLANFDPGYIISDYQMSNYTSMSEAQIQNFLKQKGNCNDTRTYLASYYTDYSYHIKDGHFVCLADETFGEGTDYGDAAPNGASAAHIIWQAAQDYRINPQVLIVLLQKEQSLVTDSWPNNRQYRSATGYGCPDTAACSSQYYGFKNQVRKAAEMFRTVLDGGWTNYPLGNNYVQYNPNAGCGGSVINIRSLATSALYRYTPYQPNASALAAGYGAGDTCGAYGNRNFYLYFEDWFGGIIETYKNVAIPKGVYYIQSTASKTKVIDVNAGLKQNGANVQLYEKNNTDAQKWLVVYNKDTDDYTFINEGSKKVLDVEAASIEDGANIQIWEENHSCAQRWKIISEDNDNIRIISECSYKFLTTNGDSDGSNIIIAGSKNLNTQKWILIPANEIENGVYIITSSLNNARVLDIAGGTHNAGDGTNIQLWVNNYTAAQRWHVSKLEDGYYSIKNLESNKSIDVNAAGKKNGTNIQVWENNQTCAQKWKILETENGYTFISSCGHGVLDLAAGRMAAGTNIQIYEANNTKAQQWWLQKVPIIEEGEYNIVSGLSDNKVLDIAGNSKEYGANVQLYQLNNTSAQKWAVSYDKETDLYTIYNSGTNKVLDVQAAGKVNNTNVQSWGKNNTCAQKWVISKAGESYIFYSACSSLVLDVDAGRIDNGTNIQLYEFNNTKAQRWSLLKLNS